jgi:general secretion pathway protein L
LTTLYIHLPCKATIDLASRWLDIACSYALVNDKNVIEREAVSSITNLSAAIAKAQQVVILLAASDVTLLQVSIPPLSAAKLKAALPNLVEDQLLGNPADCLVIAGEVSSGLRTVAVVQRAWLEKINQALISLGARHVSILPAQLCLPHKADRITAAVIQQSGNVDLTLRLSEQTGMGLALASQQPSDVVQTLCAAIPELPITLYVAQADLPLYQAAINTAALQGRISLVANTWSVWVSGAHNTTLNLMTGLNSESNIKVDWRPWHWALILAVGILFINICALNYDWWQMSREAKNLHATMTQIYQARYPKESVIIDPIAQMQQKIAFAKRDAGLATPNDFTSLAAQFSEAWNNAAASNKPTISMLEYREHALLVSFKAGSNNDSEALLQKIQAALISHNLSLNVAPAQAGTTTWQIRSTH